MAGETKCIEKDVSDVLAVDCTPNSVLYHSKVSIQTILINIFSSIREIAIEQSTKILEKYKIKIDLHPVFENTYGYRVQCEFYSRFGGGGRVKERCEKLGVL
jgi:hypothetical protein